MRVVECKTGLFRERNNKHVINSNNLYGMASMASFTIVILLVRI